MPLDTLTDAQHQRRHFTVLGQLRHAGLPPGVPSIRASSALSRRVDVVKLVLVIWLGQRDQLLLDAALGEHEDEARRLRRGRDEVDVAQPARPRLGRSCQSGRMRRRGDRGRGQPEPLLAGELDLAELVPDHEPLDRGNLHVRRYLLDVQPVAGISRDSSGARVRMRQIAGPLELGHDVAHGGRAHAQAVALDERLTANRLRGSRRIPR